MDDGAVGFPNKPTYQAPVFQKLDNAIHWINHYPLDSGAIGFPNTYASPIPLDIALSGG